MFAKFEQFELDKILSFWQKASNYFCQSVDAILEEVSVVKTFVWCLSINQKTSIFQCFKSSVIQQV